MKPEAEVRKTRKARILAALEVCKRWFGEGVFNVISPAKDGGVEVRWLSSEDRLSLWTLEFSEDSEEELESCLLKELSRRLGSGREESWEELELFAESVGAGAEVEDGRTFG